MDSSIRFRVLVWHESISMRLQRKLHNNRFIITFRPRQPLLVPLNHHKATLKPTRDLLLKHRTFERTKWRYQEKSPTFSSDNPNSVLLKQSTFGRWAPRKWPTSHSYPAQNQCLTDCHIWEARWHRKLVFSPLVKHYFGDSASRKNCSVSRGRKWKETKESSLNSYVRNNILDWDKVEKSQIWDCSGSKGERREKGIWMYHFVHLEVRLFSILKNQLCPQ